MITFGGRGGTVVSQNLSARGCPAVKTFEGRGGAVALDFVGGFGAVVITLVGGVY